MSSRLWVLRVRVAPHLNLTSIIKLRSTRPFCTQLPKTMGPLALRIEGRTFRDPSNREVRLRGLNVAADSKVPRKPDLRSHVAEGFFDGDDVSFIGRPFTVDEAHGHFARIRRYGFDTLRYVFTWEAIEHAGPGKYDEAWIEHTVSILRLAKEYGFYVILDPHQDVVGDLHTCPA